MALHWPVTFCQAGWTSHCVYNRKWGVCNVKWGSDQLSSDAFLWTLDESIDRLLGVFLDWGGQKFITKSFFIRCYPQLLSPCVSKFKGTLYFFLSYHPCSKIFLCKNWPIFHRITHSITHSGIQSLIHSIAHRALVIAPSKLWFKMTCHL